MTEDSGEELTGVTALERVADIARTLADTKHLDATLQRVVDLAEEYIEHCAGATLLFVRPDDSIVTPAWSNPEARAADIAQHETGEGPCLSAIREHETIVIDDLASEDRWPKWRAAVSELGWRSMVGVRLFVAENTMGALNLYSVRTHGFDEQSQALAKVFASHAAVAMKAAISDLGLKRALESRDLIGQAKGVLMERERLSAQQAFHRLRELSNQHNVKLGELARAIAETGEIPDRPSH